MTQPHENETALPTAERANETGERIGMWAGRVVGRMRRAAGALNQEADRMDTPGAEAEQEQETSTEHPTMQRAEELVGKAGEYVSHWTLIGNVNLRRAMARLREDMEDMWVEAHEIEHHRHEKKHEEFHGELL